MRSNRLSRRGLLTGLLATSGMAAAQMRPGRSPAFRSGFSFLGAGATAITTLPAVSSTPLVWYGWQRLVAGYAGPLYRLTGGVGGGTFTVNQDASGQPDLTGYTAWAGSNTIKGDIWYDQTGGGNHATQTTDGSRPYFEPLNAIRGKQPFTFYGGQQFNIPAAVTGNGQAATIVSLAARMSNGSTGGTNQAQWQIGAAWNTSGALSYTTTIPSGIRLLTSTTFVGTSRYGRSQPAVEAVVSSASAMALHLDGKVSSVAANNAGTFAGGIIGSGGAGPYIWYGGCFAFGIYPAALSSSDLASVKAALYTMGDVLSAPTVKLVSPGNSIVQGTGSTLGRNNLFYTDPLLNKRIAIYNLGVFGQLASTIYSDRANYINQYDPALPLNIMVAPEPTNDIDGTASGSIVGTGATLWSSYTLPFINAAIAAGFSVLAPTTIKRGWSGSATDISQKETERLSYNSTLRANLPAGAVLVDYAADDASLSLPDNVHPNSASYQTYMAPRQAAAINGLLGAVSTTVTRIADFIAGSYNGITPTFSRASAGYAQTTSGSLTAFASGALRRTDQGAVLEPASTNVLARSNDLSVTPWSLFNNGAASISAVAASGTAPDGTNSATLVTINRAATTEYAQVAQTLTGTAAGYIGSIYLKANTAGDVGKVVPVALYNGSAYATISFVTLTSAWVRVTISATLAASASCQIILGYFPAGAGGGSQTGAVAFQAWGAQLETGSVPSTPIQTLSASATRAADSFSFTVPSGQTKLTYTFSDGTQSTVAVTAGAAYSLLTSPGKYVSYLDTF